MNFNMLYCLSFYLQHNWWHELWKTKYLCSTFWTKVSIITRCTSYINQILSVTIQIWQTLNTVVINFLMFIIDFPAPGLFHTVLIITCTECTLLVNNKIFLKPTITWSRQINILSQFDNITFSLFYFSK